MRSYGVREGSRDEVLAELDQLGLDATRNGSQDKADRLADAWRGIRDGDDEAWINERQVYRVTRTDE